MSNTELVEQFLHSYFHGDEASLMACVADDFEWLNMALPKATTRGRAALAAKLAVPNLGLPLPLEHADHVTSLMIEQNGLLMHERIDRLTFRSQVLEIPCAAAWEFDKGRIARWRDYYDIGLVLRFFAGLGHPLDTAKWW